MKKLRLNSDHVNLFRAFVKLILSNKPEELFASMKYLDLPEPSVMLMSKRLFDPKYITREQFERIGITDPELIQRRNHIGKESDEAFDTWKSKLRQHLNVNFGQNAKLFKIIKFYLSDWESLAITK